jgi:hypothetical protein
MKNVVVQHWAIAIEILVRQRFCIMYKYVLHNILNCVCVGICACNERQTSSNGLNKPGLSGDCSYFIEVPRSDDSYSIFGLYKKDNQDSD